MVSSWRALPGMCGLRSGTMTWPRPLVLAGTALALLAGQGRGGPALAGQGRGGPALAAQAAPAAKAGPAVLHVGQIDRQDVPARDGCELDTLTEPDVAVSPFSARIQVAVAQDCRFSGGGAADISYSWTHDGGAHWHHAPIPGLATAGGGHWDAASDPSVAFGADGTVYVAVLVLGRRAGNGIAVSRSVDGGATFAPPVLVQRRAGHRFFDDKPWLVADTQPSSPFYGRSYVFWTQLVNQGGVGGLPQLVSWSDDQGRRWSAPHLVTSHTDVTENSQPVIQPDGSIVDTYLSFSDLLARTSTDGGASWSTSSRITSNVGTGPAGIRCCLPRTAGDPSTGRLYTVWEANGPGATDPVELSWSATGRHWTHPVAVAHHNATTQYINAAVAASQGRVYVSYGIRGTARRDRNRVWQDIVTSVGHGSTFGPPITLGPPSNLAYAAVSGGRFPGDYAGLSATPARITLAWCVSSRPRNPVRAYNQTLYAAVLSTPGGH